MSHRFNSKTSLFLMELIIAIMFFAIAGAVCVRLFSGAYIITESDKNLNKAVRCAQNLAETFYGCNGRLPMMKNMFPSSMVAQEESDNEGVLVMFFDENWTEMDNETLTASYEAIIDIKKEKASEVYSDVNDYNVELVGNALVGRIAILDVRKCEEVFTRIPETDELIIYRLNVDCYQKED